MTSDELRGFIAAKPFRPFEVALENGDRHRVAHPEWIRTTPSWVLLELEDGGFVVFEAGDVTSVRVLGRSGGKKKV